MIPPLETLGLAVGAIWMHRLRSLLTVIGVVIGVATIIAVVSAIAGLNGFVRDQIFSLRPDVFILSKFGIIQGRDEFLRAQRRRDLTLDEMERLGHLCSSCAGIGATAQGRKSLRYGSERLPDVQVTGSTANLVELYNLDVQEGRFFTEGEAHGGSPVAVIGWDVRDELFPGLDPLGRTVIVEGYPVKIIGVLRRQGSILGQSQDNVAWIPLKVHDKLFGRNRSLDIWVRAASLERFGEAQDEIRVLLRRMRGLPFSAEDPFGIVTAEALQQLWRGISAAAFAMMVLIAGITLVIGGIVIMNIMLVSVAERTHEIGLRASIGARRRDILLQFLLEAAILSGSGGLVGVLIGLGAAFGIELWSPLPTSVSPALVAMALCTAIGVGMLFGLWPAWRASRLDPIEALRAD